jgi:predicted metalloprotease
MRWKGRERSDNVEDRRGMPGAAVAGGGGLLVIIIVGIAILLGAPPEDIKKLVDQAQQANPGQTQRTSPAPDDDAREFISVVLRDNEKVWTKIFREELGARYREPKLVIFQGSVRTEGCGAASSQVGPFYCPMDQTVYIDPEFFEQLAKRHRAPGDFAQAYVIAHEVGHHIQVLTGFMERVNEVRARGNTLETNKATVRLELQADYLAGVWAYHAHKEYQILEEGDIEQGIVAANQIGDDTLMRESGMAVDHRRFTHGTSKQRVYWFKKGLTSGDFAGCKELFEVSEAMLDPANR